MRPVIPTALMMATALFAGAAGAQPAARPTAIGPPGSDAAPPAPAVKPGMPVIDRSGAQVGVVQTVAEARQGGLSVVAKIDGKLIGLDASTLQLRDEGVISSQTKPEMLAAAGAPR
jgi:hypothetical protein